MAVNRKEVESLIRGVTGTALFRVVVHDNYIACEIEEAAQKGAEYVLSFYGTVETSVIRGVAHIIARRVEYTLIRKT